MTHFVRRAVPGALSVGVLTAVLASCDSTTLTSSSGDKVVPTVTLAVEGFSGSAAKTDSVNVRSSLNVTVNANDNAAIQSVVTSVVIDGAVLRSDSVANAAGTTTVTRTSKLQLGGVRSGQLVVVRATAYDGGGNKGSAEVTAVAYDPAIPRVLLLNPDIAVIGGGTYTFNVQGIDSLGITKIGYRSSGPSALTRSDSSLFAVPYPKNDTVTFSFTVPATTGVGTQFTVEPFAENRDGLRGTGEKVTVTVVAPGVDTQTPLVYQTVPPRLETGDSLDIIARDPDGLVKAIGYVVKDSSGFQLASVEVPISSPAQQIVRRLEWNVPVTLRGRGMFVIGYAVDQANHKGFSVANGTNIPVSSDALAKRDPTVYAFGHTTALPSGSLGADIAVDTVRNRVYVSNINKNQLEAFDYGATVSKLAAVSVGAQPWGMTIDNSGSFLLVANSGGTNISRVDLSSRIETSRIKTANAYLYDVGWSKDQTSGGYKYTVSAPIDYSDRPQYVAQSASGALYYSTRPTAEATPGTLRRIDDFLDPRAEPRQIWQYGAVARGHWVILNADAVDVLEGQNGVPDSIIVCDHPVGSTPAAAQCIQDATIPGAVTALRATGANVAEVKDLSVASLALPDTNFVAVGGDRRRVAFGEANSGGAAGRVVLVFDPSGTPAYGEQYSAPIEVKDLTNNASDHVFGVAINNNSTNIAVHGVETFFSDSSLRLQGKFATFNSGAGVAFHPRNVDEQTADLSARVAFVASGDFSVQIVDSYSYRLRGRIPIRSNLYGPLRAVMPTPAERSADPSLVVKLFGLTPEGLVMIDVHASDIQ
ncbi:MAG TPA: beta-propeller fold lactonase family protein [Kofleriaceae bacterium]|nr:beta-propeller fold lactonase family protein [Kofleriaceae bacterium]